MVQMFKLECYTNNVMNLFIRTIPGAVASGDVQLLRDLLKAQEKVDSGVVGYALYICK